MRTKTDERGGMNNRPEYANPLIKTAIGVLVIVLGTSVAIWAIPANYSELGDLRISGLILAISLIAPTCFNWSNDAFRLLRGENILLGGLVYWVLLDVLQASYAITVSEEAIRGEFLLLGIAGVGFWIGACLGKPLRFRFLTAEAFRPWSDATLIFLTALAFLLGIWDFLLHSDFDIEILSQNLAFSRFESVWQREQLGDWSAFSYHLQYFGYLVPPLAVLIYVRLGAFRMATLAAAGMALTILLLHGQGGGRRIVGAMVLAGLFCWFFSFRRLNVPKGLFALALVGGLLAIMQAMLFYRGIGIGDTSSEISYFDYLHVDDNFLHIAQMLEFVPDPYPYVDWNYVLLAIVRPIPRALWPGKPIDPGFDLAEILGFPGTGLALTAPGEFYVSFGYVAVFFGSWVYGKFATITNALLEDSRASVNPLFPGLTLVWLFVGIRSMIEIMLMGYVLIAALFLSKIFGIANALLNLSSAKRTEVR